MLQAEGHLTRALRRTNAIVGDTRATPGVVARAQLLRGELHLARAEYEAAETALREAYWIATAQDSAPIAARAAQTLAHLVGGILARQREGQEWSRHARTARARSAPQAC